jgi:hypothetical protein
LIFETAFSWADAVHNIAAASGIVSRYRLIKVASISTRILIGFAFPGPCSMLPQKRNNTGRIEGGIVVPVMGVPKDGPS